PPPVVWPISATLISFVPPEGDLPNDEPSFSFPLIQHCRHSLTTIYLRIYART
uniref:Uncharacterized protein n=1 Tax=Plectus sambesii TaxID=2011161 RepID=A0A914WCE0_9BILA